MNFTFDEVKHLYYLDGKRMTGCTSVLGMIAKPALLPWAAKMAVEYIKENYKGELTNELLETAKKAHTLKRDKAAKQGTDIHAIIENRIKEAIEVGGIINGHELNEEFQVSNFIDWAMNNKVVFLESEKRVYSIKHFTAGTYDFKCKIDDKIYIGDIKTSSGIYDRTPFAQCAAYQMMEMEMGGTDKIDGRLIINIKKDDKFTEDDVYVSYFYEDDLALFLAALEIYRNLNNKFEPLKTKSGK